MKATQQLEYVQFTLSEEIIDAQEKMSNSAQFVWIDIMLHGAPIWFISRLIRLWLENNGYLLFVITTQHLQDYLYAAYYRIIFNPFQAKLTNFLKGFPCFLSIEIYLRLKCRYIISDSLRLKHNFEP